VRYDQIIQNLSTCTKKWPLTIKFSFDIQMLIIAAPIDVSLGWAAYETLTQFKFYFYLLLKKRILIKKW